MTETQIKLEDELRRIAREMDEVGSDPDPHRQFCCSKYDSDLLRDAAQEIERLQKGKENQMYFPESKLANRYIHPLIEAGAKGIEVGGSAHNSWGPKIAAATVNVDYTDDMDTVYKREEVKLCGQALPVDVVARADVLPFEDSTYHWILHSHVVEHIANPIRAHMEWWRVLANDSIIFAHVPQRDAHPGDVGRPLTTLNHLVGDYHGGIDEETHPYGGDTKIECRGGHYHVFSAESYVAMIQWINVAIRKMFEVMHTQPVDDKVGNSFVIVLKVVK